MPTLPRQQEGKTWGERSQIQNLLRVNLADFLLAVPISILTKSSLPLSVGLYGIMLCFLTYLCNKDIDTKLSEYEALGLPSTLIISKMTPILHTDGQEHSTSFMYPPS